VFIPSVAELYEDPSQLSTTLHFGQIESILEGKYRPGHFRGVGLVIAKLFNIIKPDSSYFGQKDLQQYHLIKQLIRDLSYEIELFCVPTVREDDGLAFSSRNVRISGKYRSQANKFYECLMECKNRLKRGEKPGRVKIFASDFLLQFPALRLEYIELVDTENFTVAEELNKDKKVALCIAGYVNNIRLIDNVFIN
jgi:pantoate--beta-alanine ligase